MAACADRLADASPPLSMWLTARHRRDRHQHQLARPPVHHAVRPPAVSRQQAAVFPAQVPVQAGEQLRGTTGGQLTRAVRDVRVEHRADPGPVRRHEPVVRRAQFARERGQAGRRIGGQHGRGFRRVVAEHPAETHADLRRRGPAQGGQIVFERRARTARGGNEEFRPAGAVVHQQRPGPGEVERRAGEFVPRPAQPRPGCRLPVAAGELLQAGHGFRQRRNREARRGQFRDAEFDHQRHEPSMQCPAK